MPPNSVVRVAAWIEVIVGATLLVTIDVPCQLLFGARPEGLGVALARFVGVSVLALGIACLPSRAGRTPRRIVLALLIYNLGVTILFAWVGLSTKFHGLLLWPVVVLHIVIAAGLLPALKTQPGDA